MCKLRDYRQSDEVHVFRLMKEVLAIYGLKTNPEVTDKDISDIQRNYIDNKGYFAILEDKGSVVGSYGIFRLSDDICELRKMYLKKEYQGRGLGKLMMEDALTKAKALGFKKMVLETNSILKEAIGLYRKYGFKNFVPEHLSDRCDCAMERDI
ncbi:MAG: GNAT family N-acetyltransferase [Sedimentisphaerales bacterium]